MLCQAAAGELTLVSSDLVIAEIVWVLESLYQLAPTRIAPLIRGILATLMENLGIDELDSFDKKHVARLTAITRREP